MNIPVTHIVEEITEMNIPVTRIVEKIVNIPVSQIVEDIAEVTIPVPQIGRDRRDEQILDCVEEYPEPLL